jgi:alginate O-acetyltransferase complex protein AlgI
VLFSSVIFIFFFLPLSLAVYFLTPQRFKNLSFLVMSLLFYFWTEGNYLLVLIASLLGNYGFALLIEKYGRNGKGKRGKIALSIAIAFNIGLLIFFKYLDFMARQFGFLGMLTGFASAVPRIYVPIGISFFSFKALSYVIDVYRKDVRAQKNIIDYGLYHSFFPQVLAGPIARYRDVASQMIGRSMTLEGFRAGMERFIIGLGKKVLIANQLGPLVDQVFSLPLTRLSCPAAWLGIICYTLQIYFDFSGYTDMAIGLGRMFGFDTPENFNYPYIARSVREFWRRWHITLSEWFRDYLYIPLGGNRGSSYRTYCNLLVVFLLCGMWHGASWTFIVWGLWHGLFLAFERTKPGSKLSRLGILSHLYTCLVFVLGWVFFRSADMTQAVNYLKAMAGLNVRGPAQPFAALIDAKVIALLLIGTIGSTPAMRDLVRRIGSHTEARLSLMATRQLVASAVLFGIFILSLSATSYDVYKAFIYFKF